MDDSENTNTTPATPPDAAASSTPETELLPEVATKPTSPIASTTPGSTETENQAESDAARDSLLTGGQASRSNQGDSKKSFESVANSTPEKTTSTETISPTPLPPAPVNAPVPAMPTFLEQLMALLGIANAKRAQKRVENYEKIMAYAREKQKVVNNDVEKLIGVKDAQATRYLNELVKRGQLVKFGFNRNTFYKPTD